MPMDILDPHEHNYWGRNRFEIDMGLIVNELQEGNVLAGNIDGISVSDQVRHQYNNLDLEEWNAQDKFRKELLKDSG